VRADIHDGQEHNRSMQGPDTEAQDHPPFIQIQLATRGRSIQKCHERKSQRSLDHLVGDEQYRLRYGKPERQDEFKEDRQFAKSEAAERKHCFFPKTTRTRKTRVAARAGSLPMYSPLRGGEDSL
jgi:hypothetical protein